MPELPEVEHLRRTLEPAIVGAKVMSVHLRRQDILEEWENPQPGDTELQLLRGAIIHEIRRKGKNLAIVTRDGRVLGIHLGMSGQVRIDPTGTPNSIRKHDHCEWALTRKNTAFRMVFHDPRRFGGLFAHRNVAELDTRRWNLIGPDALQITGPLLQERCGNSRRAIKSVLLDQSVIAGVGNIYADEGLFRAGIDPRKMAIRISKEQFESLSKSITTILQLAIRSKGSTVRTYRDSNGSSGDFVKHLRVYGRTGLACLACGQLLHSGQVAQRTTVWCPKCQTRS